MTEIEELILVSKLMLQQQEMMSQYSDEVATYLKTKYGVIHPVAFNQHFREKWLWEVEKN